MTLPVNIDSSYADDAGDASRKLHQQHHDTVHAFVNGGAPVLGSTQYAPASDTTYSTTSTTLVDVNAANLSVTFTAPASGAVIVAFSAICNNTGGNRVIWGVREGTTSLVEQLVWASSSVHRALLFLKITGLTPGASLTYKWAHRTDNVASASQHLSGSGAPNTVTWGPAIMEISAA